jgi:flavin reductase (DIM6/NTAB) family NADH-FMN oxidoreductase RutF
MGLDERDMTLSFARPSPEKFRDVEWQPGHRGVPLLDKAVAIFACSTYQRIEVGDHEMFIGRVHDFRHSHRPPLVFHRGAFTALHNAQGEVQ